MLSKIAALALVVLAADPAWVKQVEGWRAKHEADYTRDYVPLAGLAFLKEGVNNAGSSPSNQVVLPRRLPATIGRFMYRAGRITFEPSAGAGVALKGKPVESPITLRSDGDSGGPDRLRFADVSFWVHKSGDRRAIRIHDPQSNVAKAFAGYRWFPIDEQYRVVGRVHQGSDASRAEDPDAGRRLRRVPHGRRRGIHAARADGPDAAR